MNSEGQSFSIYVSPDTHTYVNDSLGQFTYYLKTPINLKNQNYEIALSEIIFPNTCYNIPQKDEFFQLNYYFPDPAVSGDVPQALPAPLWHIFSKKNKYILKFAIRVKIEPGYYHTVEDLLSYIQERVHFLLNHENVYRVKDPNKKGSTNDIVKYYNSFIIHTSKTDEFFIGQNHDIKNDVTNFFKRFIFKKTQFRTTIEEAEIDENTSIEMILSKNISHMLGFKCITQNYRLFEVYSNSSLTAEYQAVLGFPGDLLFLYTDIISHPLLGDYQKNLLKIICVNSIENNTATFGSILRQDYENLLYVPLNTKYLNQIKFFLRTVTGDRAGFKDSAHTVTLRLHFRPISKFLF